jgi:hypothetical protein
MDTDGEWGVAGAEGEPRRRTGWHPPSLKLLEDGTEGEMVGGTAWQTGNAVYRT